MLIEIDTGMDRAGTDTVADTGELAARIEDLPSLSLSGVTGYEGHCSLEPDAASRADKQRLAMDHLAACVEAVRHGGHTLPIVSAGGTATWNLTLPIRA